MINARVSGSDSQPILVVSTCRRLLPVKVMQRSVAFKTVTYLTVLVSNGKACNLARSHAGIVALEGTVA